MTTTSKSRLIRLPVDIANDLSRRAIIENTTISEIILAYMRKGGYHFSPANVKDAEAGIPLVTKFATAEKKEAAAKSVRKRLKIKRADPKVLDTSLPVAARHVLSEAAKVKTKKQERVKK